MRITSQRKNDGQQKLQTHHNSKQKQPFYKKQQKMQSSKSGDGGPELNK